MTKVILDSGAYTAYHQGSPIKLKDYAKFLRKHDTDFPLRFNLDVIGDEKASYDNWIKLRKNGIDTIPVYHLDYDPGNTDDYWLLKYLEKTNHIAIGAVANLSTSQRELGLERTWKTHLMDSDGNPTAKVHGLGVTAPALISRYPWHSIDSNSPVISAANGRVYLPKIVNGEFDFIAGRTYSVSDQGNHQSGTVTSYLSLPKLYKERFKELFAVHGIEVGDIQYQPKRLTRKQKKANEKKQTQSVPLFDLTEEKVEEEVQPTLANDWTRRVAWNLYFWESLIQQLPDLHFPDGAVQKTIFYSVTAATTILDVAKAMEKPPKILVSYAYLKPSETYLNQVIEYQHEN